MDCKGMATPMALNLKLLSDASCQTVDTTSDDLMCLTNTRPDTCFAVNDLSQFLTDSRHAHLVAKHAVRYLKGTVDYGIKFEANQNINLEGYVDSDWSGSVIDRKRTLG